MTKIELARLLKKKFGVAYKIQGMNIYISHINGDTLLSALSEVNSRHELGYKRFFKKKKECGRTLIGSVPFGIAITIGHCLPVDTKNNDHGQA